MTSIGRGASPVRHTRVSVTFDGTAGLGEFNTVVPLFTTTGSVLVHILTAECTVSLTGASATVSLGTTSQVAQFIALATATTIDAGMFWTLATALAGAADIDGKQQLVVTNENILIDPLTADVTGGTLVVDVFYEPLTDNGLLS